jgi:hypothetical protein
MIWAVSLSTCEAYPPRSHSRGTVIGIQGLVGVGKREPPSPSRALPPITITRGCTSMHFGENELSRSSVGISPLTTVHPIVLQH